MDRHQYASGPLPGLDSLYCDTSFLLDLFSSHLLTSNEPPVLTSRQRMRVDAAHAFFLRCQEADAQVLTSVFAIEEAFHVLLWQFVREDIRESHGRWKTWKQYRLQSADQFLVALESGREDLAEFDTWWRDAGILLLHAAQHPRGRVVSELHTINDARTLLDRLEVDVMDAFHYSAMRRFGLANAASSDADWTEFPVGTLYTFSHTAR